MGSLQCTGCALDVALRLLSCMFVMLPALGAKTLPQTHSVYSVQYTVWSIQCAVYSVQYTVCSVQYVVCTM